MPAEGENRFLRITGTCEAPGIQRSRAGSRFTRGSLAKYPLSYSQRTPRFNVSRRVALNVSPVYHEVRVS